MENVDNEVLKNIAKLAGVPTGEMKGHIDTYIRLVEEAEWKQQMTAEGSGNSLRSVLLKINR